MPESSTLTTRLPSHIPVIHGPNVTVAKVLRVVNVARKVAAAVRRVECELVVVMQQQQQPSVDRLSDEQSSCVTTSTPTSDSTSKPRARIVKPPPPPPSSNTAAAAHQHSPLDSVRD